MGISRFESPRTGTFDSCMKVRMSTGYESLGSVAAIVFVKLFMVR